MCASFFLFYVVDVLEIIFSCAIKIQTMAVMCLNCFDSSVRFMSEEEERKKGRRSKKRRNLGFFN